MSSPARTSGRGGALKRLILWGLPAVAGALLVWIILFPDNWMNWLGFSHYDYFTAGTNYAFTSGPGPMLLAAIGYSTIITGLWHAHNCHMDGCWNVGKHRVNGTPWCNAHVDEARNQKSEMDLLRELVELQRQTLEAVRGGTP